MNDNGKESEKENMKEKEEIKEINEIKNEKENDKNEIILKNENINIDELWDKNPKYKLNYTKILEIINKGTQYSNSKNELLCNMLLMPQKIQLSDKISSLNALSSFYRLRKQGDLLCRIANKFEKNLESLMAIDPSLVANVFIRTMDILQKQGNYIYAYKYLKKTKTVIEKNAVIIKQKYNVENFENFCQEVEANFLKNVIIYRKKFTDDESLKDEDIQQIKKIIDSLIDDKYEFDDKEYLYVINKKWVLKAKSFIENYIKSKKDNIKNFFEESFEQLFIYESYFDIKNEKNKDKDKNSKNKPRLFFAFPGLINNFEITAFKDFWNDSINLDENYFIKKGKKLNEDYFLINEKNWKFLSDIFGATNELKRRKDNLDLFELKFILFDKRINEDNENLNLLKQKYMLINKNVSMKELKQKLIRITNEVLNIEIEKIKQNKINTKKIDKNENKDKKEKDEKPKNKENEGENNIKKEESKENIVDNEEKQKKEIKKEENKINEEKKKEGKEGEVNAEKNNNENKKESNENKQEKKENEDLKIKEEKEEKAKQNDTENINNEKKQITEEQVKEEQKEKTEEKKDIKEEKNLITNENKLENNEFNKENEDKNKEMSKNKTDINISFYILDKDKKELLIEFICSFESLSKAYDSLFINEIPKEEIDDSKPLTNLLNIYKKEKHILIIELYKNDDKFLYDLKKAMNSNFVCLICSKPIDNLQKRYKCDICNFSLFCSEECSNKSKPHIRLDNKLFRLKDKKFVLSELFSTNLNSMLSANSKHGRIGLINMGNTCYMNSALQCLSNTEDLTKYFLLDSFKAEINNGSSLSSKGMISKAYYDLIDILWNESCTHVAPKKFRVTFCKKTGLFMNNEQQDSQEFLLALLDNLHEDLNRITNKKYLEMDEQRKGESDEKASKRWWDYHISRENSIIVDLFHGQYKSTIKCMDCENTSTSYDTYMSIGLPIPTFKTQIQIKLLTESLNFIDLNIKLDDDVQIKDIIRRATSFLNMKKYKEYLINQKKDIKNDKDFEVPMNILYNNIEIIEFNDSFNMQKIYKTAFENINNNIKSKDNINQPLFDNLRLSNLYKNNFTTELILFEKNINSNENNNINTYIYPITTKKKEGIFGSSNKDIILSYPIIISIKIENTLEDLHSLIYEKFKQFLKLDSNQKDSIEICFPHFSKDWGKLKINDNICPICQKKCDSKKYCQLTNKKVLISDLIKKQGKQRPLIFFAKSQNYKTNKEIYKGIPLFNEKSTADIKNSRNNLSIYDAFDLFNKEEYLEGDNQWYCNKCRTHRNASKKIEIYKTPLYLIVQLKRFKHRNNIFRFILGNKNTTYIDYKEVLNLKEFVAGPDKDKSIYELYAITIHREFMNGGHYYAFCKNKGIWITFDDEELSPCENPVSKDAYLLFYKRKNEI